MALSDECLVETLLPELAEVSMRTVRGMGDHARYQPGLPARLDAVTKTWQVRVLTQENLEELAARSTVSPFLVEGVPSPNDAELVVLSALRMTEHVFRPEALEECVRRGLLHEGYGGLQRGGPVPGQLSHCDSSNLLPIVRNFLTRLDGLHVGKQLLLFFKVGRLRGARFSGDVQELCRALRCQCEASGFDRGLLAEWLEQMRQVSADLVENHTYDPIDVREAVARGEAFLVSLSRASWREYGVMAEAAAFKSKDLPYVTPRFYAALASCVEAQLHPRVQPRVDAAELRELRRAMQLCGMFHVEAAAYRLAAQQRSLRPAPPPCAVPVAVVADPPARAAPLDLVAVAALALVLTRGRANRAALLVLAAACLGRRLARGAAR